MQGARKFANLFETGQYGRFYIVSGSHARGKTFNIQILPEDEVAKGNGPGNRCLNSNAVEVYGIVSGQPGWTEAYGWLHEGPWVKDFEELFNVQLAKFKEKEAVEKKAREEREQARKDRELAILSLYCKGKEDVK